MPQWLTLVLTGFYVCWLCAVLFFLYIIWRSGERRSRCIDHALIESALDSAKAAKSAADAAQVLAAQEGENAAHTD